MRRIYSRYYFFRGVYYAFRQIIEAIETHDTAERHYAFISRAGMWKLSLTYTAYPKADPLNLPGQAIIVDEQGVAYVQ